MKAEGNRRPRFSLRTLLLFVCLVASGVGLWWRWGPWVEGMTQEKKFIKSGTTKVYIQDSGGINFMASLAFQMAPDGKRKLTCNAPSQPSNISEIQSITGKTLFRFNEIFLGRFLDNDTLELESESLVSLWHRRRPEQWWGIAWLWESWAVLAFGMGLAWSVVKDWKGLKVKPEAEPTTLNAEAS